MNKIETRPDIHLNPVKSFVDIKEREFICLSEFLLLLEPQIKYYLHPWFYKDESENITSDIHDRLISGLGWSIDEKCY